MSDTVRIGILGGTFDPLHNAHIAMARAALEQENLNKVLFMVSGRPPHKNKGPQAGAETRYAMVEAALEGEAQMEASRIEVERPGKSYLCDTLAELKKQYPGAVLLMIMGHDSLADLPNWREPERIVELAELLIVPRTAKHSREGMNSQEACCPPHKMLKFEKNDLSSTDLRKAIASGEAFEHLVPDAVARMIREKRIYHDESAN